MYSFKESYTDIGQDVSKYNKACSFVRAFDRLASEIATLFVFLRVEHVSSSPFSCAIMNASN